MLPLLFRLLVLAAVAAIVWRALRPRPAFVLRIRHGAVAVEASRGQVSRAFVADVNDECRRCDVVHGTIKGEWKGRRISLSFSSEIPPSSRQRLRNVWELTGQGTS